MENANTYSPQSSLAFPNYSFERDGWFPSDPDCPNHTQGAPFSTSYANHNSVGEMACAHCFVHSAIMQSMAKECSHLHASASCSSCYSKDNECSSSLTMSRCSSSEPISNITHQKRVFTATAHPERSLVNLSDLGTHRLTHTMHSNHSEERFTPIKERPLPQEELDNFHRDLNHLSLVQHMPQQIISPLQPSDRLITPFQNHQMFDDTSRSFAKASALNKIADKPTTDDMQQGSISTKQTEHSPSQSISMNQKTPKRSPLKSDHDAKHSRKRRADAACEVCGDRASGYHYNALTCEGCKGFFRRTIHKKLIISCKFGGSCEMDTYTRRKCPECRLKKCRAVGMLEECILTEVQCRSKRRRKKSKTITDDKDLDIGGSSSPLPSEPIFLSPSTSTFQSESEIDELDEKRKLSIATPEENLLECVGEAFKAYRSNPEIIKGWATYLNNSTARFHSNLCEMATAHVKVLVDFTKKLPGFTEVGAEDQITLLKGSVVEIMLLRNSSGYNLNGNNIDVSMMAQKTGLHEAHFRTLLDFFSRVKVLGLDDTEYGLLSAVILFDSDHSQSDDKASIDGYRDRYISAMKTYSESKQPKRTQIVAKILNLITELRTLYDTHWKIVTTMREKEELTPLLCEIWDLR